MSTSETVTFDQGPCPCGAGRVERHVTTQDNPWSTADILVTVECGRCSSEWRVDGSFLVLRDSEIALHKARTEESNVYHQLRELTDELVDQYFEQLGPMNKKAQLEEMERLGISNLSYRQYLVSRKAGRTPGQSANALKNPEWLLGQAQEGNSREQLETLLKLQERARIQSAKAAKEVVRRRIG